MNEDKATRYHRLRRRTGVAGVAGAALLLGGVVSSGMAVALRGGAERLAERLGVPPAWEPWATVAVFVVLLAALIEALAFPLALYRGFVLERRYDLGKVSLGRWLRDYATGALVGGVLGLAAAETVYASLRWSPLWGWPLSGLLLWLASASLVWLAPVLLLPLFYRFVPLEREGLRERLLALAAQARTAVVGVYEWKLGERSRAANAALVGVGPTRRILVSDTLLADYSDAEIEVVLAHELAHHVHGDIRTALVVDAGVTALGLALGAAALVLLGPRMGITGSADVAGLPVLLLAGGAVVLVATPALNALSRAHERRADRYALDLTGNPEAFVAAMRRLGAQNLADERPSRLSEWFFHTHPPLPQRIDLARAWTPKG